MIFSIVRHIEINEGDQGINLTEFSFMPIGEMGDDKLIKAFLDSDAYRIDSLRDLVKNNKENGAYLRRAFDMDKVKIPDFRKTGKGGVSEFLEAFLQEPDWRTDRDDFEQLLARYSEVNGQLEETDFYILSKDWFDKDDERLIEPESWVYVYYFLIISVDATKGLLTFMEWTYD